MVFGRHKQNKCGMNHMATRITYHFVSAYMHTIRHTSRWIVSNILFIYSAFCVQVQTLAHIHMIHAQNPRHKLVYNYLCCRFSRRGTDTVHMGQNWCLLRLLLLPHLCGRPCCHSRVHPGCKLISIEYVCLIDFIGSRHYLLCDLYEWHVSLCNESCSAGRPSGCLYVHLAWQKLYTLEWKTSKMQTWRAVCDPRTTHVLLSIESHFRLAFTLASVA